MKIRSILAIIATFILIVDVIIENTINISMPTAVFYTKNIVLLLLLIYIVVILFMIIVNKCFSSNSSFKFKYRPLNLKYDDVLLWLEKGNIPDTLYLKGAKKEFVKIEIKFSTIGKNGPFVNKCILLDNKELPLDRINNEL